MVDKLLKEGADPNIVNKDGKTPLDLANSNSDKKTGAALKNAGAATSNTLDQQLLAEAEAIIAEAENNERIRKGQYAIEEKAGTDKALDAELEAMLAELAPSGNKTATESHDPFKAEMAELEAELAAQEKANLAAGFKDPDAKLLDTNDVNSVLAGLNNAKPEKKSFIGRMADKVAGFFNPKKTKSPEELMKGFQEALAGAEKNGADYKDRDGNTLLHYAVQAGAKDVVDKLLKEGADPNIVNKDGKTPLDLANASKDKNVAKAIAQPLEEAGAATSTDLKAQKVALAHAEAINDHNREFDELMANNLPKSIGSQKALDAELAAMEAALNISPKTSNAAQKPPFNPERMTSEYPPRPAPNNLSPSQGAGKAPAQGTGKARS